MPAYFICATCIKWQGELKIPSLQLPLSICQLFCMVAAQMGTTSCQPPKGSPPEISRSRVHIGTYCQLLSSTGSKQVCHVQKSIALYEAVITSQSKRNTHKKYRHYLLFSNFCILSRWSLDLGFSLKNFFHSHYQFSGKWKGIYTNFSRMQASLNETVFLCIWRKRKTTNPIFFKVSFEDMYMSELKS